MIWLFLVVLQAWGCVLPAPGPGDLPPVAVADEVVVYGYTDYLEIPVFANDYDPEGEPIQVVALGDTAHGRAVLLKGGAVGVYPDYPTGHGTYYGKRTLIGSGEYVISDGSQTSIGHWTVWHELSSPAPGR